MNIIDFKSPTNVGFRLLLFRRAIHKSQKELADQIGITLTEYQSIEDGNTYPEIEFMHNINIEYGLSINWLLCNEGEMFASDCPEQVDSEYVMTPLAGNVYDFVAQHSSFIMLMRVPIIARALNQRLVELRHEMQYENNS